MGSFLQGIWGFPEIGEMGFDTTGKCASRGAFVAKICPLCSGANGALLAVNPLFRGKTAPKSRKRPDLPKTATWVPRGPGSGPFGQKNFSSRLSRATRKAVEAGIWQVKKVSSLRKLCCEPAAFWTGEAQRLYYPGSRMGQGLSDRTLSDFFFVFIFKELYYNSRSCHDPKVHYET